MSPQHFSKRNVHGQVEHGWQVRLNWSQSEAMWKVSPLHLAPSSEVQDHDTVMCGCWTASLVLWTSANVEWSTTTGRPTKGITCAWYRRRIYCLSTKPSSLLRRRLGMNSWSNQSTMGIASKARRSGGAWSLSCTGPGWRPNSHESVNGGRWARAEGPGRSPLDLLRPDRSWLDHICQGQPSGIAWSMAAPPIVMDICQLPLRLLAVNYRHWR